MRAWRWGMIMTIAGATGCVALLDIQSDPPVVADASDAALVDVETDAVLATDGDADAGNENAPDAASRDADASLVD